MAATPGNPYAAPRTSVSDAAPKLGLFTRAARALAFLGNAFLLFLPVVLFFSSRRSETGFLVLSGYCATVAIASIMDWKWSLETRSIAGDTTLKPNPTTASSLKSRSTRFSFRGSGAMRAP